MFERTETLHRGKVFIAFTYQNFHRQYRLGRPEQYSRVLPLPNQIQPTYVETNTRVDLKVNQFAAYATYGLTVRKKDNAWKLIMYSKMTTPF